MKSFLLKDKKPTILWGQIPDNIFFEGEIPEGYSLAISPNAPYIILDIDRHGEISGFDNIPEELDYELFTHFNYATKNNGRHIWLKYTGNKILMNKSTNLGIDLRTHKGYVRWYLDGDIRQYIHKVKDTSETLNVWLEKLFS